MPRRIKQRRVTRRTHKGRKLNKRQKMQVKRIVGRETEDKHFDQFTASTGVLVTGTLFNAFLTGPAQGVGDTQRTGDAVISKRLEVRLSIILGDNTNIVRIIFFQWHSNNAVATVATNQILQDPTNAVWSPINETNEKGRLFSIMLDRTYSMTGGSPTLAQSPTTLITRNFRFYGRGLKRKRIEFNPGAVTGFNAYYCLAVSDSAAAPNPSVTMSYRYTFTDA